MGDLETPFLTDEEVGYLVKMNTYGDFYLAQRETGTFTVNRFSPAAYGDAEARLTYGLLQAKERVASILRHVEQGGVTRFDAFVSNMSIAHPGQRWFTVTLEEKSNAP